MKYAVHTNVKRFTMANLPDANYFFTLIVKRYTKDSAFVCSEGGVVAKLNSGHSPVKSSACAAETGLPIVRAAGLHYNLCQLSWLRNNKRKKCAAFFPMKVLFASFSFKKRKKNK